MISNLDESLIFIIQVGFVLNVTLFPRLWTTCGLDCNPPSFSCLKLARGLIPLSLTEFLGIYFSSPTIWSILDTPLHDFHFDLYVQIWLCRSIFFHHWKSAQGITKKMKLSALDPSSISHTSFNIPPDSSIPSLATFSLYLGFLFGDESDLRTCWIVDSHWPSGKDGIKS
ncbi:hypothetical protein GLOIN_2v1785823 [Rhizophagus irregularis DAOM 181602=DAOM 197198]|nr:hypothetical protein GLOIN_2v1785823 [Rhizophagus irregularis DAOM 181602=DAOM 197198]